MIDDETRQRAKEYTDSFSEATAEDPKSPAPDLEPMEAAKSEEAASRPILDDDVKAFGEAFNAPEATPEVKPEAPAAKPNFRTAFAQARKDGLKVFDFNGKKFTTAVKSEMKAKPQPTPQQMEPAAPGPSVSAKSQLPAPMGDKKIDRNKGVDVVSPVRAFVAKAGLMNDKDRAAYEAERK